MPTADPRIYVRHEIRFAVEVSAGGQMQVCEGQDIGAGGCQLISLYPLQRGQSVRLRLRSDRTALEASGQATVAWTRRDPPYHTGLRFSEPLTAQAVPFIHAMLGPVRLTKGG